MPDASGGLILDTHIWIWVVEGSRGEIAPSAARQIESASRRGGILISAISVWEVTLLEAKGRLSLSRPIDEWVGAALRAPGVRLLDLSPAIAIESARLPGALHGDPADRMLVAGARVSGSRLATRNGRILDYARGGDVRVLDARP